MVPHPTSQVRSSQVCNGSAEPSAGSLLGRHEDQEVLAPQQVNTEGTEIFEGNECASEIERREEILINSGAPWPSSI